MQVYLLREFDSSGGERELNKVIAAFLDKSKAEQEAKRLTTENNDSEEYNYFYDVKPVDFIG